MQNVSNIKVALSILKVFFLLHLLTSGDDREHFTAPTIFLLELTRLTFWLGIKSHMSKHCYVFECFTVWDLWHLISWTGPSFILSSSLLEARRVVRGKPWICILTPASWDSSPHAGLPAPAVKLKPSLHVQSHLHLSFPWIPALPVWVLPCFSIAFSVLFRHCHSGW